MTVSTARSPRRSRALLAALLSAPSERLSGDLALIATRATLFWIFIYHGSGKLFGWFNGPGLHRTALYFSNTAGLHPGGLFAVIGGITEFAGAIALALGLASRLAGLAIFGDMVMAMITVSWTNGIVSEKPAPGYELNLALAVLALVVAICGAGTFSVDRFAHRRILAATTPLDAFEHKTEPG